MSCRPDALTGVSALQRTTLIFAHAAPDPVVLAGFQRPCEALFTDVTTAAHLLGLFDLHDRGPGVADGEEEFRVLIPARPSLEPVVRMFRIRSAHEFLSSGGRVATITILTYFY